MCKIPRVFQEKVEGQERWGKRNVVKTQKNFYLCILVFKKRLKSRNFEDKLSVFGLLWSFNRRPKVFTNRRETICEYFYQNQKKLKTVIFLVFQRILPRNRFSCKDSSNLQYPLFPVETRKRPWKPLFYILENPIFLNFCHHELSDHWRCQLTWQWHLYKNKLKVISSSSSFSPLLNFVLLKEESLRLTKASGGGALPFIFD